MVHINSILSHYGRSLSLADIKSQVDVGLVPVAPVAYQVILEPGIGQFREAPPSAYSYKFVGTFSCAQNDLRKGRERELATLDEKSTSSGIAEPYAR